jgi:hypothetical protein
MNAHTPGPWTIETLATSCGHCLKVMPPHACIYVDGQRIPHDLRNKPSVSNPPSSRTTLPKRSTTPTCSPSAKRRRAPCARPSCARSRHARSRRSRGGETSRRSRRAPSRPCRVTVLPSEHADWVRDYEQHERVFNAHSTTHTKGEPMSRSNPTDGVRNPSTRWFEWAGGDDAGFVRWYNKDTKPTCRSRLPFTFLFLDELATIKGWHEPSKSGIYANEIRDTRQDVLVVKSFKGGEIASGLYAGHQGSVKAAGGGYCSSSTSPSRTSVSCDRQPRDQGRAARRLDGLQAQCGPRRRTRTARACPRTTSTPCRSPASSTATMITVTEQARPVRTRRRDGARRAERPVQPRRRGLHRHAAAQAAADRAPRGANETPRT